jgi:hypothetical protein
LTSPFGGCGEGRNKKIQSPRLPNTAGALVFNAQHGLISWEYYNILIQLQLLPQAMAQTFRRLEAFISKNC